MCAELYLLNKDEMKKQILGKWIILVVRNGILKGTTVPHIKQVLRFKVLEDLIPSFPSLTRAICSQLLFFKER